MMSSVSEIMESLSSVRSSAWMGEADVVIVETGEGYGGGGRSGWHRWAVSCIVLNLLTLETIAGCWWEVIVEVTPSDGGRRRAFVHKEVTG